MPDIPVWNKCDNRCRMCANTREFRRASPDRFLLAGQIRRFERYLSGAAGVYARNAAERSALNLTGGEPALNPDFLKILSYFRKRNRAGELALLSNGRRFADAGFAAAALKAAGSPFSVAVPFHGASAAAHDSVTGARGSFSAALAGARNIFALKGPGQTVEIRLVLHRRNIDGLNGTLKFLLSEFSRFGGWRAVALHYELEGRAVENQASLALRLPDSASAVNAAAYLIRRFGEFRLYHFPLCFLKKELRRFSWISLPPEDRIYPAGCGGCRLRRGCTGLMSSYYARYGAGEIPVPENMRGRARQV
jgi:MoaA/NifB/PqqE/SkfB family radical SAM enzyme